MARMITLQSSDSVSVDIDWDSMLCSQTLSTMLVDLGLSESGDSIVVPVKLDGATLKKVVEWCIHHKGETLPTDAENIKVTPDWDKEFLQVDDESLCKIVMAANYLDISLLLEYGASVLASHLDSEGTEDKIRARYNIECDLTNEEQEKIKQENAWIE